MIRAAIGTPEIAVVVGVVVLLFCVKRLPEIGKSLAEGICEFKKSSKKIHEDDEDQQAEDSQV